MGTPSLPTAACVVALAVVTAASQLRARDAALLAGGLAALAVGAVVRQATRKPVLHTHESRAPPTAAGEGRAKPQGFSARRVPERLDAVVIGSGMGGPSRAKTASRS